MQSAKRIDERQRYEYFLGIIKGGVDFNPKEEYDDAKENQHDGESTESAKGFKFKQKVQILRNDLAESSFQLQFA